jgi:hypothetical protein
LVTIPASNTLPGAATSKSGQCRDAGSHRPVNMRLR